MDISITRKVQGQNISCEENVMKGVRPDFSLCLQDEADVFDEPRHGFIISADTILKTGHQSQMSDISVYHYLANSMQDRYDIFQ